MKFLKSKKVFALILVTAICLSTAGIALPVFADNGSGTTLDPWKISKDIDDDVFAYIANDDRFILSGIGDVADFEEYQTPWEGCDIDTVEVGVHITSIGKNAFYGFEDITEIICLAEEPPEIEENAFGSLDSKALIYVPRDFIESYETADFWEDYTILPIDSETKKIATHLYETEYYDWNFGKATAIAEMIAKKSNEKEYTQTAYEMYQYYADNEIFKYIIDHLPNFACTSCRNENLIGRNFDWIYDDVDEYVIRVPKTVDHHASIGVASAFFPQAVQEAVGMEDILPMLTMDGVNDCGVAINVNVVASCAFGDTVGTAPGKPRLCAGFVVRYILDNASSAAEAVQLLQEHDVFSIKTQEFHWMISDSEETYVVECVDNNLVALKKAKDEEPAMSNFHLSNSPNWYDEGYEVVLPEDPEKQDELFGHLYSPYALGVERYNMATDGLSLIDSDEEMLEHMQGIWYKQIFIPGNERRFWSDQNLHIIKWKGVPVMFTYYDDGKDLDEARMASFKLGQDIYAAVLERELLTGKRLGKDEVFNGVVHTVHTSVYDIESQTLLLNVQERSTPLRFDMHESVHSNMTPLYVNGDNVGVAERCDVPGEEWTYQSGTLTILGDGPYYLTGVAEAEITIENTTGAEIITDLPGMAFDDSFSGKDFSVKANGNDGVIAVALYNDKSLNRLAEVKLFRLSEGEVPQGEFTEDGSYIKAFWWSDFETMTPLCKAIEKDIQEN